MAIDSHIHHSIAESITALQPYRVMDHRGMIKLDAMENPYGLPAELQSDFAAALKQASIHRYPNPEAQSLRPLLRQVMEIDEGLALMFGNGSDELIQIISVAARGSGQPIMAPEPSFVMYGLICQQLGIPFIGTPLQEDFSLDVATMLKLIQQHQPAVIFLAYPNNPTGNLFAEDDIKAILAAAPGLVVVDEAYQIFSQHSFMPMISEYENLVVMRTLSKAGLAGLRFGYLIGLPDWLEQFNKVRLPYNINCLTQISIEFLLKHYLLFQQQAERILEQRLQLISAMNDLPNIEVFRSAANFILFRCLVPGADAVFQHLIQENILIKSLHGTHPLLEQCLRVTVGLPEENSRFLTSLESTLKG